MICPVCKNDRLVITETPEVLKEECGCGYWYTKLRLVEPVNTTDGKRSKSDAEERTSGDSNTGKN